MQIDEAKAKDEKKPRSPQGYEADLRVFSALAIRTVGGVAWCRSPSEER
jgi:hypothetical protein